MIRICRFRLTVPTIAVMVLGVAPLQGADGTPEWLTGRDFQKKLTLPATVLWADSPLRENLVDFGRAQHIAVLLDRRVDPDQKLELAVREEPVLAIFRTVAISRDLGASILGDVVYVGPPTSAQRIRTVAQLRRQEIATLGTHASQKFSKRAPMAWLDLDSPRNLLGELAEQNELAFIGLDQVPHDLWAANDLPSMSLVERLTLILHQFDLTFQVAKDARRVAIGPVPQDVSIVRDYPGGANSKALCEKWRARAPKCEYRIVGRRIYVRGLVEDHERLEETGTSAGKPSTRPRGNPESDQPSEQVFTADVPNRPLGTVLDHFARQLGLELQIDHASLENGGVSLEQLISFRVEEATFDELFQALLGPVGCTHERQGDVLRIRAKHGSK